MSILILIAEPQLSSPVRGMTKEPSDAETCLHVSISEANKSSPVRGMTSKASAARMSILILIAEPQQSDHEVE